MEHIQSVLLDRNYYKNLNEAKNEIKRLGLLISFKGKSPDVTNKNIDFVSHHQIIKYLDIVSSI